MDILRWGADCEVLSPPTLREAVRARLGEDMRSARKSDLPARTAEEQECYERLRLLPGEVVQTRRVRFRTLGCYPLTGAIDSDADTLEKIIAEMLVSTTSERQGRVIDHDPSASMEKKKQEGYF